MRLAHIIVLVTCYVQSMQTNSGGSWKHNISSAVDCRGTVCL